MHRYNPRLVFRTPVRRCRERGGGPSPSPRGFEHMHTGRHLALPSKVRGGFRQEVNCSRVWRLSRTSPGRTGRKEHSRKPRVWDGTPGLESCRKGEGSVRSTASPWQRSCTRPEGHSYRCRVRNAHLPHSTMTRGLLILPFFTFSLRHLHYFSLPYMHIFC